MSSPSGSLCTMIMTGRAPLSRMPTRAIVHAAYRGECPPLEWPSVMPLMEQTRALCEECLQVKSASRPSIVEVQSALHCWPQSAAPDDTMFALREALPRQKQPQEDLIKALAQATSMQSGATNWPGSSQHGELQQKSHDSPLLAPRFLETSLQSNV
mmetsp:Transcript_67566/g.181847  ORF Transcript_67566/g.181847 Transcript_67566/m.181847 type:complete len:156 (-) Transcript_67566:432-899(-)